MNKLLKTLAIYKKPHILAISALSFSCGVPFLLIVSTLPLWLKDVQCDMQQIGCAFLITIPYSIKFLYAPFIDQYTIPWLTPKLGKRRSWAILAQLLLFATTLMLAQTSPEKNIHLTALCAFLVCCCAATQDIVLDAYRIERLAKDELAIGTSMSGVGFRLGMLLSGGGTIYLANYFDWHMVFRIVAVIGLIGPLIILCVKEPDHEKLLNANINKMYHFAKDSITDYLSLVIKSFANITRHKNWGYILLFILLFKISDSIPNTMNTLFFHDMGFSKMQIGDAKSLSIIAMILGTITAGFLINRDAILKGILFAGLLQVLSPLSFYIMTYIGCHGVALLWIQAIQAFVCGIGATAFVTYLSSLCSGGFTATQFSVIYSFSSIARIILAYSASHFMHYSNHAWAKLFFIATLTSLCFIFPVWKMARDKSKDI